MTPPDEESAKSAAAPANDDDKEKPDPQKGYKGKYNWSDKVNTPATNVILSSGAITDYSWCDGTKKVSVYVTLTGLDDIPDDDISVTLSENKRGFTFQVILKSKKRVLTIDPLNDKVGEVKFLRKKGKDMVVIKLTKVDKGRTWYTIKGSGGSGGGIDYEDDDSDEEFDDLGDDDVDIGEEVEEEEPKKEEAASASDADAAMHDDASVSGADPVVDSVKDDDTGNDDEKMAEAS